MRNPIFKNLWYHGKTPELQIKTLKLIVVSGLLSKKKVTHQLTANYPDVSNAMDALLAKKFIRLSAKYQTSGRNPEKFYKITERGLRALLEIRLSAEEFWRAIILLCMSSEKPIAQREFEDYYRKFESNLLGHFNIHGYFFLTHLFDNILDQWLLLLQAQDDSHLVPLSQKVIECLSLYGPLTIDKLVEKIAESREQDLLKILENYSIQSVSTNIAAQSETNVNKKKIYYDFILHTLIVSKEAADVGVVYELSLFGVMLAMAIISYHFVGIDIFRQRTIYNNSDVIPRLKLFYNDIDQKEYYDTIAKNYKDKIPLIFGKWDFLKSELGAMLYDSFDFLIYKSSRSDNMDKSIWSLGNKEFYDEIQELTYNAIDRLSPIHAFGTIMLREYEEHQAWIANNPRIIPVYNKLREIGEILKYADITFILEGLRKGDSFPHQLQDRNLYTINDIKNIENVFRDELCFLFYLSLNTVILPPTYKKSFPQPRLEQEMLIVPHGFKEAAQEIFRVGSLPERLIVILAKDKDIKQWFSAWIGGIIEYRSQTSDQMLEFYNQVINSNLTNMEKGKFDSNADKKKAATTYYYHQEYDITKICSDIDSVYDYSNSVNRNPKSMQVN
jgi:DNA-binding PadR family transcriptional regulator